MGRPVYPANQLRGFINTINDLSADLVLQESMNHFNVKYYNQKIEESLIEKDEEKFMKYTNLLKEL
ncbi:IDEAL domain protein [Jeotgalicoccus saudimassiliensis]|uniref:IDEAL domain protein n=1 Tax=Jeotgalicoccus saudimassiliensis TaxID=1461582 RepID=A0A078M499_9STAP|nr:IDEAL domain-containing protein [Jeotgalicoccus saudimassiliensis]CEA01069.1 IDEAL domain protein [Jeotgalicoccus saudimassiliensis]